MTEERNPMEVDKPVKDDDAKNAIGEKIGPYYAKYPNARKLRAAEIPVTVTIFEPKTPSSKKGYLVTITGLLDTIDFTAMAPMIKVEGRKIKLSEIVDIEVPELPEEYDGGTGMTEKDRANAQASTEAEMRKQYEKQMALERQRWEEDKRRRLEHMYDRGDYAPSDSEYDPFPDYGCDEMPPEESVRSEDGAPRKRKDKWEGVELYAKKKTSKKKAA